MPFFTKGLNPSLITARVKSYPVVIQTKLSLQACLQREAGVFLRRNLQSADLHCCGRKLSKVLSLSDCSVWTQDGEADVTVAALEPPGHLTTEYTFGRDSREWCTAIVLSFTCTSCKCSSWDDTHPLLKCEPLPTMAHAALIRVESCGYTLCEWVDALLTHSDFLWVLLWNARLRLGLHALCCPSF